MAKDLVTIEKMPVDTGKTLTGEIKKQIVKIVETEFENKESIYHEKERLEREQILEGYKKEIGFDKLLKSIKDAEDKLCQAEEKLKKAGLDDTGKPEQSTQYINGRHVTNYSAKKLDNLLSAVAKNAPSATLKAKLISRIWLASTYGEAMVILNQVLGNGIIPTLTKDQMKK